MYPRRSLFAMAMPIALIALAAFAQPKTFNFDADAAGSIWNTRCFDYEETLCADRRLFAARCRALFRSTGDAWV